MVHPTASSIGGPPLSSALSSAQTDDQPSPPTVEPLRLPSAGLLAIPAQLVTKIRAGSFIDFGDLLPEALQVAFDRAQDDRGKEEKRKRFPIDSIGDWAMAFGTYMAIRVQSKPSLAIPLATYLTIITRLAREAPGQSWQRYDRLFRQASASNPDLPWDRREPDIWLAAITEQHQPLWPAGTRYPSPGSSKPTGPSEICRRFSRGQCPASSFSCRYRHACGVCQAGGHPAIHCPLLHPPRTTTSTFRCKVILHEGDAVSDSRCRRSTALNAENIHFVLSLLA